MRVELDRSRATIKWVAPTRSSQSACEVVFMSSGRPRPLAEGEKSRPWRMITRGRDAQVWKDNSFEIFLANAPKNPKAPARKYVHFGVSASGSRCDAEWTYVPPTLPTLDIPRLDIAIDGDASDWGDGGLKVNSLTGPYRNKFGKRREAEIALWSSK